MNDLFLALVIIGFMGVPVSLILSIIRFIKKKPAKPTLILCCVSFAIFIISFIGFGITIPEKSTSDITETEESSTEVINTTESATMETTVPQTTVVESSVLETTTIPETTATLSDKEIFINSLISNSNVTQDAANNTYNILTDSLGFQKLSVNKNTMGTLFDVEADNYNLKITVSDKLYMIICGDYNMYKDDTVKYTKLDLEDRVIGNNDTSYYVIAQEIITRNLKNPSSAHFSSVNNCQMAKKGEYVAVKGYVDATNSYGTQVRNEFVVEFRVLDLSSFSYETVYISINGEKTGTYIDLK